MLDRLFFMFCCFVSVRCNQDRFYEVWGSIVLFYTCSVLFSVFEQSRADNSTAVPFQRGTQLPLFFIIIFFYQKSNSAVIQLKLHFVKYIYCVSFHKIGHNKLINYCGYSPGKFGLLMYCTVVDAVKVIIDEHAVPAEIKQKQFILLLPRT